ncbi:MAG TPA: hypothetical protein VJT31_22745 [Rugosimonospora sp.]|nr:hypothetical protein [Rugosimonospora sp.]
MMVAERNGPDPGPVRGGLQIQVSKLLLASIVAAIATSVAMVVAVAMLPPDRPPPGLGPNDQPPPPPGSAVVLIIITGLFVVSWTAVVATLARDQILRRMREVGEAPQARAETLELLAALRREVAEDRRADLAALEARITALTAEYGEQRETDGYVNGMRAARHDPPPAEVRPLHRVPPTA